ncbi:hypothetical protein GCM10011375_04180 [Hymenobacter qilianensis]|uniref:Uncharacterized protein n=1 Tax=Hymenobacter qilianensis TaxID=1385715 RepID=A0ACB5PM11_9BACT|nr:DUF3857 domain-containing protein [Hymenobacter qilianensis]GGF51894.1 hypothetical protein GCM10011375_04180 [Hymenobacter qilianensis]
MKKRISSAWLLAFVFVLTIPALCAQKLPPNLTYATYSWDAKRKRLPVTEAEAKMPAVVMRDFSAHEFTYDESAKSLRLFSLDHRIVRVNTSDGIERFNKIYVPVQNGGQILLLKARTISPRGEVVEVSEANMKELKDEDGGRGYKIFAVEGVEKGSEIEYVYSYEHAANFFGRAYMQSEVAAHNVTFELISPEQFTFDMRLYQGATSNTVADTVQNGKRIMRIALDNVPAALEEGFANMQAERMRVEYKLAYNSARGRVRLFTWADASQHLHTLIYGFTKDEQKALDKLLKQMNLPAQASSTEKAAAAEHYIKINFQLNEATDKDLVRVVATRAASQMGFARLFAAILSKLSVEHELVVTSNRNEAPFDEAFDTWNYLEHYAFYLPATKQWLAPGRADYRMPLIPAEWTATRGLFVRTVKLGSTESAVGTVREIPTLTADQSQDDLAIAVRFGAAMDKATVDIKQTMGGYQAQQIQPFYSQIPDDKRTEAMQTLVKGNVPDATFQRLVVTNGEPGLNPLLKPFIVDATVETAALLDRAGSKYLFKVGTLLGVQSELYQNETRQYDVENAYNRRYQRTITFELPAGYQVRNLQDLNIVAKAGPGSTPTYLFESSYEQKGQAVTVTINEHYREVRWPKKDFEAFRNVVNAAANFNKVVLVLEKKAS